METPEEKAAFVMFLRDLADRVERSPYEQLACRCGEARDLDWKACALGPSTAQVPNGRVTLALELDYYDASLDRRG